VGGHTLGRVSEPTARISPVDIDVERTRAVTIEFGDGERGVFEVAALRAACPCAACRGLRERGEDAWPRPGQAATIAVADAQLTGAWGLSIDWSDGHSTGIYSWSVLRDWWDRGLRGGLAADPRPGAGG
jgi:DUF971 family protein